MVIPQEKGDSGEHIASTPPTSKMTPTASGGSVKGLVQGIDLEIDAELK